MKILLVEATLTGFNRLKDGSVNLKFTTLQEASKDGFGLMDDYFQKKGHLAFKTDVVEIGDLPTENTRIKGQKSPSQMLRYKLFALHMKKGGTKETFPAYYEKVMAGFERNVQEQLDDLED